MPSLVLVASIPALWLTYKFYERVVHVRHLSDLPGPPPVSYLWGDVFDLKKAPVGTLWRVWRKKYGPTYVIHEPLAEPILVLGDAKGAAHVLNRTSIYWRPEIDRSVLALWFGESVLSSEGQNHAERRRRLNPAFNSQSVQQVSPILFDLAYRLEADWADKLGVEESVVLDVSGALHKFSLDAISMTMFAHNVSGGDGPNSVKTLLKNISDGPSGGDTTLSRVAVIVIGLFPQLLALPNPLKKWAMMLRTELGKIAQEVWDTGKTNESVGGMDARVLEVLSQQSKAGEKISKEDAVAEIIGLLFAGSETVANVMGEFLYEMAHQPLIQQKLRQELVDFESRHGPISSLTDLTVLGKDGLKYLDAVTMEIMRCKAVLMDISRMATVEDSIPLTTPIPGSNKNAIHVRPGQVISIPVRDGINHDPLIWGEDAEIFRPERWFEPGTAERGPGLGGILTFGDGAKMCIGRAFALAEFKIVASVLIRHFSFHPADEIDFYHLGGNTVKPKVRGREEEGVKLPLTIRRV
ncbi:cytochrome P450 [Trametopsis cervina]|nr:cytochrome P450 [Trametopsis cervina]